jgi:predicted Zn finger-like uncharacterized protein
MCGVILLTFACPQCSRSYKVPEDKAGKRTRCVACGTSLTVPDGRPALAPDATTPVASSAGVGISLPAPAKPGHQEQPAAEQPRGELLHRR